MMPVYSYPYNAEDYNPSMPVVEIEILPHRKSTHEVAALAIVDNRVGCHFDPCLDFASN
jgi:hypothetical protein